METIFMAFSTLLRTSLEASGLIVLVLIAQWLCGPRLKPRWRYLLWGLVVLRLTVPWSIPVPNALTDVLKEPAAVQASQPWPQYLAPESATVLKMKEVAAAVSFADNSALTWVWLAGILCMAGFAAFNQYKLHIRITRERPLIHEPTLLLLEECKSLMGVRTPITLVETDAITSPGLFGFIRPRLLLPRGFFSNFNREELRHVFLHELAHVKRGDIFVGWVMLVLQAVHWFNPFVWLAFYRMRTDRELACDALALSCAQTGENESYGLTIIKLLEQFGRSSFRPGLAGILENKQQMKERINMIAKFRKTERGLALAVFVLTGLMLATVTLSCSKSAQTNAPPATPQAAAPQTATPQAVQAQNADEPGPPQIVSTSPSVGETDVDPAITEITVTFDRDMSKGFSWTGGGPAFPTGREGEKVHWRDLRTCVLPVKLEAGHYYRVGINSQSYHGFQSANGVPAEPSAIYFATQGASQQVQRMVSKPEIVALSPKNGTMDVDPKLTEIRVTFNVAMGGGFSWTGGGSDFPKSPDGKSPYWTDDHKTCVLPVALEPGKTYQFGLNSPSYKNFQSSGGVPLDPVRITFSTRGN
ncbi:MAG TPA: M56 family metallopeptidase [Alphaproteobacteria bacterium]|nr:M56 family metallopeptidase [Alphaproteobacteria bacterium]